MRDWFDKLYAKRKQFVDATNNNGFEKGVWRSTVDKYADPAHFVYELMQNAEDQSATKAEFRLERDALIFSHNGFQFTEDDVENITGIGNTAKLDDDAKIGRFGIGFKSVFVITDRPQIHTTVNDDPFSFAIENLVLPVILPVDTTISGVRTTKFMFPFIEQKQDVLGTIILERLKSLGADVLLFLDSLKEIYWQAGSEEGTCFCERRFPIRGCIKTRLLEDQGVRGKNEYFQDREYIQFFKRVDLPQSSRNLEVRIAFCMSEGHIVPEQGQQTLDVYFPTKEVTNLKFRVHAPTVLTDNRANIKENDAVNALLIQKAADLLAESLPRLRDIDLLDIGCLRSLPMDTEWNNSAFKPFYTGTQKVFREIALLPKEGVGWVKSTDAKIADSQPVQQLLTSLQLTQLFGSEVPLHWISADITEKAQETASLWRYCRDVMKIEVVDPDKLAAKLTVEFLEMQDDDWMIRFYNFLSEREGLLKPYGGVFRNKPFIRLEDGRHVSPFNDAGEPQVYLPRFGGSDYLTVKAVLAENAQSMLDYLGIKQPNAVDDAIEKILRRYSEGIHPQTWSEYWADLEKIAIAIGEATPQQRHLLLKQLIDTPFVLSRSAADKEVIDYRKPDETLFRTPQLDLWYSGNEDIWFVEESLATNNNWDTIRPFLGDWPKQQIQMRITVQPDNRNHVKLEDSHGKHRRGLDCFDPGARLDGLDYALGGITVTKAQIIWSCLLDCAYLIRGVVETSRSKNFGNPKTEEMFSVFGQLCVSNAWVPKKDGQFYLPKQALLDDLPDGFEKDTDRAKLVAKCLGMVTASKSNIELYSEELDIPPDIMSRMIKTYKANPKNLEEALYAAEMKQRIPQFPSAPAKNPSRRSQRAEERAMSAEEIRFGVRERSVRLSSGDVHRQSLRETYTIDDIMLCQCCIQPMPFKLSDGKHYFEAVQCVGHPIISSYHVQNYLALCPVCAAKYKNANSTDPQKIYEQIVNAEITDDPYFWVVLAEEETVIQFDPKHWIDIIGAYKANEKQAEEEDENVLS